MASFIDPLCLGTGGDVYLNLPPDEDTKTPCLICDDAFNVKDSKDDYLRHLLNDHKFVVSDVKYIANFAK